MTTAPDRDLAGRRARIPRERLAGRVAAALDAGPVVLTAGAGYGKTTILEEVVARRRSTAAWVACTAAEREPGRLLARLIDALHSAVPGAADAFGEQLAVAAEPVDVPVAARELLAELGRLLVDEVVIVIDDAEQVDGADGSIELLGELLRAAGGPLRAAIATRRSLGLRLAKLRTAGRLSEFGESDLAFGAGETAAFLRLRHGEEPEVEAVEAVMSATHGWPLAVALGTLAPAGAGEGAAPRLRSRAEVDAFLAEEVLDRLEPGRRDAVIDSSVPSRLSPGIVEALDLPAAFLDEMQRVGVFLKPVGDGGRTYAYHPLFREFLLARLAAERSPERRAELHARVAPAAAAAGLPVDAIEHWLAAGRWAEAVETLAAEGARLVRTSPATVRHWLERLPAEVRAEPDVQLLEGQLEWGAGNHERAAEVLRGAIAGLAGAGDPGRAWLARFTLSDALFSLGEFDEAVELAEGFDRPEAGAAGPLAPATALYAATCLAAVGRFAESDELAARALRSGGPELGALEAIRCAFAEVPAGGIDGAYRRVQDAAIQMEGLDPFGRRPYAMATLALMLVDQGRLEEAIALWEEVEEAGGHGTAPFLERTSRVYRALLHARAGRLAEAERELARAGTLPRTGWRNYHLDAARAVIAALRGGAAEALAAADAALALTGRAPILFRFWTAVDLVPALVQAGRPDRAAEVLAGAMALVDERLPGSAGSFLRARLLAQRAWLGRLSGDERSDADLAAVWEQAGPSVHHVVRSEWARLEPLVWSALERGRLDPAGVVRSIATAFPDGAAMVRFAGHPVAGVRRVAVGPAVASGHPEGMIALRSLAEDPDELVAGAARAAADVVAATAPPLVFSLLGGFAVRRGAWLVSDAAWGRPMAARLVRFLLVHRGSVVPEDALFDAFWPESTAAAARRNLQVAVSRARTVLDLPGAEASMVEAIDRAYRLRLGDSDIVDVDEFEAAAAAALAERGPAALGLLERAASLWGGEPLPEDRYAEWSVAWRERLTERYIAILSALTDAYMTAGDLPAATSAARELVDLDPLNESAHRELMVAYARSGRTAHALRQYLECRRTLVDQLGVEPTEATSRLQARILAGEPVRPERLRSR